GIVDKDGAFGFVADDLNLSVDDIKNAGESAKQVAGSLTSDSALRELAATMLNEQLGPAVSEVFGIGGDDLKQILIDVRVDLAAQGLELLLLIEDFSIFQGIQGGLIDAITLISTEELTLCPMRVVMAVTSGYFTDQMPDTVFTRTYKVFDLELPQDSRVVFDPTGFVARYMNAVRTGTSVLDDLYESREPIVSACEQCPVNQSCHAAFGQVDNFGLFPFNPNALSRAIDSQSKDGVFVARDVLTRVVRPVLHRDGTELEDDRFPTVAFADDFKTGALGLLDDIEELQRLRTPGDKEISDRRERLVRFWGSGAGPENLNPTIHQAFGVPPIAGLENAPDLPPVVVSTDAVEQPPQPEKATALPALVKAVDKWRATGELLMGDRNKLRNFVHAAVAARLVLEDGYGGEGSWTNGTKEFAPAFVATTSVEFDDEKLANALLPVDRDNDDDVRALRALAWVNHAGSWAGVPSGDSLERLCDQKLEQWAARVSEKLLPRREEGDDAELVRTAHTLLAMAKALGVADAFKSEAQSRVKALFASPPGHTDPEARPNLHKWQKRVIESGLGRQALQERLLRRASFTQGDGKPLAVDVTRLLRAVRDTNAEVAWPAGSPDLLTSTDEAVTSWLANLVDARAEASNRVPDVSDIGGEVAAVAAELNTLIGERINVGGLPGSIDPEGLRSAAKAVKPGDLKTVEALRSDLDRWEELTSDERLRLLTADWEKPVSRIRNWLDPALAAVSALESSLQAGPASSAQREYSEIRQDLIQNLESLAGTVSEINGPEVVA
ncbi:protein DpdH, partial [Nocardioides sp. GCM10030258]